MDLHSRRLAWGQFWSGIYVQAPTHLWNVNVSGNVGSGRESTLKEIRPQGGGVFVNYSGANILFVGNPGTPPASIA